MEVHFQLTLDHLMINNCYKSRNNGYSFKEVVSNKNGSILATCFLQSVECNVYDVKEVSFQLPLEFSSSAELYETCPK